MKVDSSKMFGEENVGKLLFRFSIPIILSMLISELYSMVDTLFVGNVVGAESIGALGLVFPIQRIIIALSMMIALGTSTAFSRANGSKDKEKAVSIVNNGFSLSILIMLTLTAVVYTFREQILIFLGASDAILPHALDYLSIIIFGSVFLSLTMFMSNIILALGNNKVAIISNAIGAITNVIIDYILVVKMPMGVKGAAIATAFSQFCGFLYAFYNYLKIKKENDMNFKLSFKIPIAASILMVGVSAFIVEAEDGIVTAVLNNLLLNSIGDEGIIILGVIAKVYLFLFVTMFGIASAMQPMTAYNIGARNYERVKEIMKTTMRYAFIAATGMWLFTLVFARILISFFISDPIIIDEAVGAFRIMVSLFPLISIYYVSIFYYQALGRARASVMVSIFRQIVVMIPVAIVLVKVFDMGALGAWLAYPISDVLAMSLSAFLLKREMKELDVLADKQKEKSKKEKRYKEEYVLN